MNKLLIKNIFWIGESWASSEKSLFTQQFLLPLWVIEIKGLLEVIVADFSMGVEKISIKKTKNYDSWLILGSFWAKPHLLTKICENHTYVFS